MKNAGRNPTLICFQALRSQIDVNRDPDREPCVADGEHAAFCRDEYIAFHAMLEAQVKRSLNDYGRCLLVDLHSFEQFWMGGADIVLGTKEGRLCPMDWSELLFQNLSKHHHLMLGREYRVTYSPDRAKGIGSRLSGGYVVRRTIETFRQIREEGRLGAIQIEVRRQPFFLNRPEIVGVHLADSLLNWLVKMG